MALREHELKNAYIGEYTNQITEIYTITNIPNNNVNKYVSIYKSGYSIKKVILEGTASFSQGYGGTTGFYARLSSNTSGSIKHGPAFGYGSSSPYDINISYNAGSGWVNTYTANNKVNATNTYKYEIDYNSWTLTFNGEVITQQLSSTEKTVVSNILNSTGACVYGARQNFYANDNPIKVTVIYEPN